MVLVHLIISKSCSPFHGARFDYSWDQPLSLVPALDFHSSVPGMDRSQDTGCFRLNFCRWLYRKTCPTTSRAWLDIEQHPGWHPGRNLVFQCALLDILIGCLSPPATDSTVYLIPASGASGQTGFIPQNALTGHHWDHVAVQVLDQLACFRSTMLTVVAGRHQTSGTVYV